MTLTSHILKKGNLREGFTQTSGFGIIFYFHSFYLILFFLYSCYKEKESSVFVFFLPTTQFSVFWLLKMIWRCAK